METILSKRKEYKVIESINEYSFIVERDNKKFICYTFTPKSKSASDFMYAYKKLSNSGIRIPKLLVKDKKKGYFIVEFIDAESVFDILRKEDLNDNIYKEAFDMNAHGKINHIAINFNPQYFVFYNNHLYYTNYTFDTYSKDKDLSTEAIYHWFYTNKFKNDLIALGLPIDNKRILPEFEGNKKIVLKVVEFYR